MTDFPQPVEYPARASIPLLVSVAHSGRFYPQSVLDRSTQGMRCLEPLEDPLVDRLAWRAIAAGVGAVVQPVARAVIDCNRGEDETDPSSIRDVAPLPVGEKARFGLGIIPSRTRRHGKLWREPIDRAEFQDRLKRIHQPYHALLTNRLAQLAARHGPVLLLDLHSMPPRPSGRTDFVVGDRHGTTAAPWIGERTLAYLRSQGFHATRNEPYAGGEIVARHGRPDTGVHAIQLEIDRSLYLDHDLREPGRGFDRIAVLIEGLVRALGDSMIDDGFAFAAE